MRLLWYIHWYQLRARAIRIEGNNRKVFMLGSIVDFKKLEDLKNTVSGGVCEVVEKV